MKINIDFFSSNLIKALGAGIYKITVEANGKSAPIYIGESLFVLVRCATHLFELDRNPEYFWFTNATIEDPDITLKFELVKPKKDIKDTKVRKCYEKELIRKFSPLSQSQISDRMKGIDEKIEALENFLN